MREISPLRPSSREEKVRRVEEPVRHEKAQRVAEHKGTARNRDLLAGPRRPALPIVHVPQDVLIAQQRASVIAATQEDPVKGASELAAVMAKTPDAAGLAKSLGPQIEAMSREANWHDGRDEDRMKSILRDLSSAAEYAGPAGRVAIASAFARKVVDDHLDVDNEDQLGGAFKRVVTDGRSPAFAIEVANQLKLQNRGDEAQGEIVKGAMEGFRDRDGQMNLDASQNYVKFLASRDHVSESQAVISHAPVAGNRAEVLLDGDEVFPRILKDIENAKSSINIHEYGFKDGELAQKMADALIAKAKQGVDVRLSTERSAVTSDSMGSPELFKKMIDAGVKVVTNDTLAPDDHDGVEGESRDRQNLLPDLPGVLHEPGHVVNSIAGSVTSDEFLHPDHRKVFIFDGKTAYTGGMGVNDAFYKKTHDTMVRLQGPVVNQMQADFLATYKWRGGDIPTDPHQLAKLFPEPHVFKDGATMRSMTNIPGPDWHPVTDEYLNQIRNAKTSIQIANPYIGDDEVMGALQDAAERGVKVTAIFPKYPEHIFAELNQQYDIDGLVKSGVEVREYQAENFHPKVMVVDGEHSLIGSANLDGASMRRNLENDVLIEGTADARELQRRLFAVEMSKSKVVPAREAEGGSLLDKAKAKVGDIADDLLGGI